MEGRLKTGKAIANVQVVVFTFLLMGSKAVAFRPCIDQATGFAIVALIGSMWILTFVLGVGVTSRNEYYLLPWLIWDVFVILATIAYLVNYESGDFKFIGYVLVFIQLLSWYPIFRLHQSLRSPRNTRGGQRHRRIPVSPEHQQISQPAIVISVPPCEVPVPSAPSMIYVDEMPRVAEATAMDDPPPSYAEVTGAQANAPYPNNATNQTIGWRVAKPSEL